MKSKPIVVYLLFLLFISLGLSLECQGMVIGNPPFGGVIGYLGPDNVSTIGQTFRLTEGDDRYLHSLSFDIYDFIGSSNPLTFGVYVYEWEGTKITGQALFKSEEITSSGYGADETITINIGNIELQIGQEYVWFLSISEYLNNPNSSVAIWRSLDYENGGIVLIDNEFDFDLLFQTDWDKRYYLKNDLAFTMELIPIPEPCTVLLFGLGGLAMVFKRR